MKLALRTLLLTFAAVFLAGCSASSTAEIPHDPTALTSELTAVSQIISDEVDGKTSDSALPVEATSEQVVAVSDSAEQDVEVQTVRNETPKESETTEVSEPPPIILRYPTYLTKYDITTPDDMRYAFLISPFLEGENPTGWMLFDEAYKLLGKYVGPALSANSIAAEITSSMPIRNLEPFEPLAELVDDCSRILGIPSPDVFVRQDPFPRAYVRDDGKGHILVITSGMLKLYDGVQNELRFVIGRELGHIKCQHGKMKLIGVSALSLLYSVDAEVMVGSKVLPTLALGRLLSWCREAEISADRAGLLCCQDPQTAYNALARLLHGVPLESDIWNPENKDFDPKQIVSNFEYWENRPFVNFLVELKKHSSAHPFIPDRIAALYVWVYSGIPESILDRSRPVPESSQQAVLEVVSVKQLADEGAVVDPYLRILHQDHTLVAKTPSQEQVRDAAWKGFREKFPCADGQPLYFEIWDANYSRDTLIGMFVIYPEQDRQLYRTEILWDVETRSGSIRTGLARVKLKFVEND